MDNVSRVYKAMFEEAEHLAKIGKAGESLDICWTMRLRPTHVNLLIAVIIEGATVPDHDLRKHPDAAKFAQECIDLVIEVKAQGFATNIPHLDYIAGEVAKIQLRIEQKVRENEQNPQHETLDDDGEGWVESDANSKSLIDDLVRKYGPSRNGFDGMTLGEMEPIQIEGMYTRKANEGRGTVEPLQASGSLPVGTSATSVVDGGTATKPADLDITDELSVPKKTPPELYKGKAGLPALSDTVQR